MPDSQAASRRSFFESVCTSEVIDRPVFWWVPQATQITAWAVSFARQLRHTGSGANRPPKDTAGGPAADIASSAALSAEEPSSPPANTAPGASTGTRILAPHLQRADLPANSDFHRNVLLQ